MKNAISVLVYLVILVTVVNAVSDLFFTREVTLPYNTTTKVRGFFAEPQDSLDVVFVGASTSFMGVNPSLLWREYGITSYDFCSAGQRVQLSQMYVKEAIARQHPMTICVDIAGMRFDDPYAPAVRNHSSLALFPLSLNKLHTIFNYTPRSEWSSHILPLIKYHSSEKIDFHNWDEYATDPYLGYSPAFENYNQTVPLLATAGITECESLVPNAEKALSEIIHVCRQNNVQLVLYCVPLRLTESERRRVNEVERIAAEAGIPVLDFNAEEWLTANEYDTTVDHSNANKHANWRGAKKISRSLGKFLIDHHMAVDHRADPAYASWNDKTEPYYRLEDIHVAKEALKTPKELESYLEALCDIPNKGTVTIVVVNDDASKKLPDGADELLARLGASEPLKGHYRYSYLLVNVDGQAFYFDMDEQNALFFETTLGDTTVQACSAGYTARKRIAEDDPGQNLDEIVIDGKAYKTKRGLNFFVYNYIEKTMVSQARFDTYSTTKRE